MNHAYISVREKFYGLLQEYLVSLRDRDSWEERFRLLPEGAERDEADLRLDAVRKRCRVLRRDILRYPSVTNDHAQSHR